MTTSTLDGIGAPFVIPAGTTQQVNDGDQLLLLGTIQNLGTIAVDDPAGNTGTTAPTLAQLALVVLASPTVTLTGGGMIALAGKLDDSIVGSSATLETLINVDNTIVGTGQFGLGGVQTIDAGDTFYPINLVNGTGGVIDANGTIGASGTSQATYVPPQAIFLDNGGPVLVNDGLIEATGIGGLFLQSDTLDQSGGGTILAAGAGVVAELGGATTDSIDLIGGTLEATGGGQIEFGDLSGTLDGSNVPVTIGSGVTIAGGIQDLLGTIVNHGTIAMSPTSYSGANMFLVTPTVALIGGGSVLNPIFTNQAGSLVTLVNGDTISGSGQIGIATVDNSAYGPFLGTAPVAVINQASGVINATGTAYNEGGGGYVTGDAIYLFGGGSVSRNDGLLEATGIGGLDINDMTLDQSGGGTLLAVGTGVAVYLQSVDVIGGTVETSNNGTIIFNGGTSTLASTGVPIAIAAGGVLEVATFISAATLVVQASTIDNAGTLIDGSSLILTSHTVTLDGGGMVQLAGVINTDGTDLLINADNTITGAGDIFGTTLAVTNAAGGVIDGTGLDIGGTLSNAGLLENVAVGFNAATTIQNTGTGRLLADGTAVGLYNAHILGGTLAATNGGSFPLGSVEDAAGNTVTLDGRGSPVTIAAGTSLQDFYDTFDASFTLEIVSNLSLLGTIDLFGTILGPGLSTEQEGNGPIGIPNAGLLVGTGTVDGYLNNTGTVMAQGGTFTVGNDIDGSGSIAIAPGAAFVLGGESGETVNFGSGPLERLILNTPTAFTGTLANLGAGDMLDLGTTDIQSAIAIGNTLTVTMVDHSTIEYKLANLLAGATITPSGSVPSELVVSCFAESTRIATPGGERAVETLIPGSRVLLASGAERDVAWIGRRQIHLRHHPEPKRVQPVRIAPDAFEDGCPHQELWLSPDHAVFVDGLLIPIKLLINGTSIAQMPVDTVVYYHVELPRHDLLLAEGMAVESYLDTGDRHHFGSARVVSLFPDFSRLTWEAQACAPLTVAGPELDAVRQRMAARNAFALETRFDGFAQSAK